MGLALAGFVATLVVAQLRRRHGRRSAGARRPKDLHGLEHLALHSLPTHGVDVAVRWRRVQMRHTLESLAQGR